MNFLKNKKTPKKFFKCYNTKLNFVFGKNLSENTFQETIRQLSPSKNIHWLDLDIFFPSFSHNEKREALVDLFGSEMKEILIRIQTDSDFAETYLGFKAFLSEEHLLPGMSHKEVNTIFVKPRRKIFSKLYFFL